MSDTTYTKSRCNECLSSLQGMLKRERTSYDAAPVGISRSDSDYPALRRSLIDVYEEVYDLCRLQNCDTVAVAVSYLDRFMAVQERFVNVQIAAMTCFYLAVKLYEPVVIPPALLCELFQRVLHCDEEEDLLEDDATTASEASAETIEALEMTVLSALKWNLNPPTSMMFVRTLLSCLPNTKNLVAWKQTAQDLAQAHLKVALKSEEITKFRSSSRALGALFIATEKLPADQRSPVYKFLLQAVHMTAAQDQREVLELQSLLKRLASKEQPEPAQKRAASSFEETPYERPAKKQRSSSVGSFTSSPRSVLFPISELILA